MKSKDQKVATTKAHKASRIQRTAREMEKNALTFKKRGRYAKRRAKFGAI